MYNIYYPEDTTKEPIGIVFHKDKFYQFFHSSTTGNPYLGALLKEANQYEFQAHNIKAIGSLPRIFDRDRTRAKAFLTELLGYLMLNQGVARFKSPI